MTEHTPLPRVLNKSVNVMSPLRRSLGPASTVVLEHTNDDERERTSRRSQAEISRNVSKANSAVVEDNQAVHAHLEACIQLFAENKINIKNVWNLRMIDYMRLLLEERRDDPGESMKLASTSLDISSKIYALRVDDVHNEVMKLADMMARLQPPKKADATPADERSDDEEGEARQADKPRKKQRHRNANIASEDSLDGPLPRSDEAYTSMQMRRGTSNVPVNLVLPMAHGSYTALVPCRASVLARWHVAEPRADAKLLPCQLPAPNRAKFGVICPSFADFVVDDTSTQDQLQTSQLSLCNEVVYDAEGVAIPEYEPTSAPLADEHSDYETGAEDEPPGNTETVHVVDMRPEFSKNSNLEYSFRPAVPVTSERFGIVGAWAGPAHWKVKQLKKPREPTVSTERQSAARGPRAVLAPVDLFAQRPPTPPLARTIRETTRHTKLLNSARSLIPESIGVAELVSEELIMKPGTFVKCLKGSVSQSQAPGPQSEAESDSHSQPFNTSVLYEYDNVEDVQYCRRVPGDEPGWVDADQCPGDDGAPDCDTNADADPTPRQLSLTITAGDLLTTPDLVVQNPVHYATHAKKVNMKALKTSMWSMVEAGCEQTIEVPFSRVYERLEAELPASTVEELTVPLAFVSLLHLANEHTLKLRGYDNLDNFSIFKD